MPAAGQPVLSVRSLSIAVGPQQIVRNLSFEVLAGERVCLLGASGSGKSLTAAAVLGLLPPSARVQGSIWIAEHSVGHLPVALRPLGARAAMVFQDSQSALNPLVSVGSQLRETLQRRQGLRPEAAKAVAADLLRAMGLPDPADIMHRCPAEFSGGQRQRICIALALACKTSLLVADEPTTALDLVTQAQVLRVLKDGTERQDAPALLFITHDLGAAAQICDRAVIIEDGAVVETGPIHAVLAAPEHAFTRKLVAAARASRIERLPSHQPGT